MLLLYREENGHKVDTNPYLHSTMLLLYPDEVNLYRLATVEFTFHYASTLSRWLLHAAVCKHIYIPLCFYFIKPPKGKKFNCIYNLHSTMLLLYRKTRSRKCAPQPIYIPLCFYFIICRRSKLLCFHIIYIPLCFYFIASPRLAPPWLDHIYIPLCFYFIKTSLPAFLPLLPNLHSTMLLLYLSRKDRMTSIYSNLHSTMLLLYLVSAFA